MVVLRVVMVRLLIVGLLGKQEEGQANSYKCEMVFLWFVFGELLWHTWWWCGWMSHYGAIELSTTKKSYVIAAGVN